MRFGLRSQRPLHRHLARAWVRLRYGRAYAHRQDSWPHLSLDQGVISYKGHIWGHIGKAQDFISLMPSEITVIGSGPSLKGQHIERLPPHSAFLLNGAISLVSDQNLTPLAVAIEDERFIYRHSKLVFSLPQPIPLLLSPSVIRAICEFDPSYFESREIYLINNALKPYGKKRVSFENLPREWVKQKGESAVSLSPEKGVIPCGTVAFSALQWALAASPQKIGLAGIDLKNTQRPRFNEKTGEIAFSGVEKAQAKILSHIELAHSVQKERGGRFVNYSSNSALETIGIPYDPLLDQE